MPDRMDSWYDFLRLPQGRASGHITPTEAVLDACFADSEKGTFLFQEGRYLGPHRVHRVLVPGNRADLPAGDRHVAPVLRPHRPARRDRDHCRVLVEELRARTRPDRCEDDLLELPFRLR